MFTARNEAGNEKRLIDSIEIQRHAGNMMASFAALPTKTEAPQ